MQRFDEYCNPERPEDIDTTEPFESPEWHPPCHYRRCHTKYGCESDCMSKCGNNIYIYPPGTIPQPNIKPIVFAQTKDMNLNVEMTEHGNIQLVSAPDQLMERGGFSLYSSEAPNDTLVLPSRGVYRLAINMKYSFLPKEDTPMNTFYQVIVQPTLDGEYLPSMSVSSGIVSRDTNQGILSTCVIINALRKNEELKLFLDKFTYSVAFKSKLNFYDILIGITQVSRYPID